MSIAYDSGGRHRPVDLRADEGDEIVLNGTRLKQARVERGLSVSDAARLVTLSREQVEQIENGGLGAFYGPRHKLLAARKYSESFGIPLEALMPQPAPPVPPAPPVAPAAPVAVPAEPDERSAQTEQAARIEPNPQQIPAMAAEAAAESVAAPQATRAEAALTTAKATADASASGSSTALVQRVAAAVDAAVDATVSSDLSQATVKRLPIAIVVGAALILVFSILRGLTPDPQPAETMAAEPVAETQTVTDNEAQPADDAAPPAPAVVAPAVVSPAPVAPTTAPTTVNAAVQTPTQAPASPTAATREGGAADSCALTAGPDTPRWAPPQARNASTRLFMTSSSPLEVCVTDAAGVSTPVMLKPGAMASASGKPPYTVRSERLAQAQIFLQGLKVRVPSSATAVHLITTQSVRSPEAPTPAE